MYSNIVKSFQILSLTTWCGEVREIDYQGDFGAAGDVEKSRRWYIVNWIYVFS